MPDNKIKVLYIAGWGRSGSTILARILGQMTGFFHGGELRTLWLDGLKPKSICGCGAPVVECATWQAIFEEGFAGLQHIRRQQMTQLRRSSEPRTQEIFLARILPGFESRLCDRLKEYQQVLDKLYRSIKSTTGSQVIVDDSNHPGYAYTLALMPNIDLSVIHLIRDPRATAYSWTKRQKKGLGTYSLRDNSLGWMLRNAATEALGTHTSVNYMRFYYETFAQDPQQSIQRILEFAGETSARFPFSSENEVRLGINHSVFGNPNRTRTGTITIKLDQEWKEKMDSNERLAVTGLTFPLLLRYGYPLLSKS